MRRRRRRGGSDDERGIFGEEDAEFLRGVDAASDGAARGDAATVLGGD